MGFKKGVSGNPAGRPRRKVTKLFGDNESLLSSEDLKSVISAVVKKAKEGDIQAAKIIIDRIYPVLKAVEISEQEDTKDEITELSDEELDRVIEESESRKS